MDWFLLSGFVLIAAFLFFWWKRSTVKRRRWGAEGNLMRAKEAGDAVGAAEWAKFIEEAEKVEHGYTNAIKLALYPVFLLLVLSFFF